MRSSGSAPTVTSPTRQRPRPVVTGGLIDPAAAAADPAGADLAVREQLASGRIPLQPRRRRHRLAGARGRVRPGPLHRVCGALQLRSPPPSPAGDFHARSSLSTRKGWRTCCRPSPGSATPSAPERPGKLSSRRAGGVSPTSAALACATRVAGAPASSSSTGSILPLSPATGSRSSWKRPGVRLSSAAASASLAPDPSPRAR